MADDYDCGSDTCDTSDTSSDVDTSTDVSDTSSNIDTSSDCSETDCTDSSSDCDLSNDGSDDLPESETDITDTSSDIDADETLDEQESDDLSNDGSDDLPESDVDTSDTEDNVDTESTDDTTDVFESEDIADDGSDELPDTEKYSERADSSIKESNDQYNERIFDEYGNLKKLNSEDYMALTPEEQELFEQKYDSLLKEEQEAYDKQYAQEDLKKYNQGIESGEYERNPSIERDLNDIINGKYSNDENIDADLMGLSSKMIASSVLSKSNLDPLTKANISDQASEIGRIYGPQAMRNMSQIASNQYGVAHITPIVHEDTEGNKTYEFYSQKPSKEDISQMGDYNKGKSDWDNNITDYIENEAQKDIYKNANLRQTEINGRPCLIKNIDYDYVDNKTGMTNRELMAKGRSPIDSTTNEKIELHHMGQSFDSPFAELAENSEHGDGNHKILHPKTADSWRNDDSLRRAYQKEKSNHWITRSKEE